MSAMLPLRHPLLALGIAALAGISGAATPAAAPPRDQARPVLARREPHVSGDTAQALHLLRRATWGPRPQDLDELLRMGRERWLDRQLHPERIDDRALGQRLAAYPAAGMEVARLFEQYPPLQAQRRDSAGGRMRPRGAHPQRMLMELAGARVARAVHTERQLEDVMADFWFNHFNVFWGKAQDRWLVSDYERSAIRPHVFGRFRDLLGATARHPAMLVYLDNAMSVATDSMRPFAMASLEPDTAARRRRPRGLNENYARELMELHTLGVAGGYTQDDVVAVARAFTGWSVTAPRATGGRPPAFIFRQRLHDGRPKTVLGQRLGGGGEAEGEAVLDLLARHPATARHVATKLVQRFVSDDPPAELVDRLAAVFRRTDGDLRAVTRALFLSPEFERARTESAKVRTPFEFVAASLRVTGADAVPSRSILETLRRMGHMPYMETAPTGYPHTKEEWTNGGAMIARMEFARSLADGRLDGVWTGEGVTDRLPSDPTALTRTLAARVLPGEPLPDGVARAVADDLGAHPELSPLMRAQRALGLLLGSPTFQRR